MRPLRSLAIPAVTAALLLTGCAGDDPDASGDGGTTTEEGEGEFAFGAPAAEADADRTIEVEASDSLSFTPAAVEVAAGETITFVVTNSGTAVHEFVIGDAAAQAEHEEEMGSGMEMHDEPNAISIDPGETGSITWQFTEAGDVEFGCHQPGHFAGGMKGVVTVS